MKTAKQSLSTSEFFYFLNLWYSKGYERTDCIKKFAAAFKMTEKEVENKFIELSA